MITGYTPAEKLEIERRQAPPPAPTINIAPTNIQRPENLPPQIGISHHRDLAPQ